MYTRDRFESHLKWLSIMTKYGICMTLDLFGHNNRVKRKMIQTSTATCTCVCLEDITCRAGLPLRLVSLPTRLSLIGTSTDLFYSMFLCVGVPPQKAVTTGNLLWRWYRTSTSSSVKRSATVNLLKLNVKSFSMPRRHIEPVLIPGFC